MWYRFLPLILLFASNIFMTYAWYGHLKDLKNKPLIIAILLSWCVAFLEYCLQVPANRIGFQFFTLGQLKVTQEVITMIVFALFSILYMKEKLTLDFLWASLCLVGAVYFMFRGVTQN
ncbi:MAG: DMT family protein [Candidatus Hydrogenedentes bacterium]|nr:DMT family protein [Candidatus Hydrogenedentota bacterium]